MSNPVAGPSRPMKKRPVSMHELSMHIKDLEQSLSPGTHEDHYLSTPPLSPSEATIPCERGRYRYLKGSQLEQGMAYDMTVVAHRRQPEIGRFKKSVRRLFSTYSTVSPGEGVKGRIVEPLVENGLLVDIIDADLSPVAEGDKRSEYFVLLIRAPDDLVQQYAKKLNWNLWLHCGTAQDLTSVMEEEPAMNPADRIQVVDHIVREASGVTETNPFVHSIFPVHDEKANSFLLREFAQSSVLDFVADSFVNQIKVYFGEKVAFYFGFLYHYNRSLLPIAILGVLLTMTRPFLGTIDYMRILVLWGFLVTIIWSFWFLRSWERRNNEMNFLWEDSLHTTNIMYPNPHFYGKECVNPITGKPDLAYATWKRYPKYFVSGLFMFIQICIMMLLIACWITIFEVLKVRFPDSSFLSVQWFSILGGGILFGLFVDVFQWNVVVSKMGKLLTEWENWKTMEQYEKALIRKLFLMDFLNYYTWFFLLCFAYVIPGVGDRITNMLNTLLWHDPPNCCFGPYLDKSSMKCHSCPQAWDSETRSSCAPCKGYVTFDRSGLNLEQLFITPIIVTQGLNLLLAVLVPWLDRKRQEYSRYSVDKKATEMMASKGTRHLLAELDYRSDAVSLSNMSAARYIENNADQVEALNAVAREILFQSGQNTYDPYDDYHFATVQYGFVVMFSMLWPLMPMACILINSLKMRGDGFRLCRTLRRPFPRKCNGIGEWENVLRFLGCTGVVVYFALVFVSTGALEFFSNDCIAEIKKTLDGDLGKFRLGPYFSCFSLTTRVVMLLIWEHIAFGLIWIFRQSMHPVPRWLEVEALKKEFDFKTKLYTKNFPVKVKKQSQPSSAFRRRSMDIETTATFSPESTSSHFCSKQRLPQETDPLIGHASDRKRRSLTAEANLSTKSLAEAWES